MECAESSGRLLYLTEVPPTDIADMFEGVPEVLDIKAVAGLLGVSADTVRREIARGRIRKFKVGTNVRISKRALIEYV